MKTTIIPLTQTRPLIDKSSRLDSYFRKRILEKLNAVEIGEVIVTENESEHCFGGTCADFPLRVRVTINHPSAWTEIALGGSCGSGEAYMRGTWECSDLVGLVRIFLRNRNALEALDTRVTRLKRPLHSLLTWFGRNNKTGSQRNISAHYDLGNAFFRLFLDPTMMYSSAYYATQDMSLDDASIAKLDRICQKLELAPEDHLLEIGTGWGGFAIHAARHYGCRVTTTTISQEQYDLACQRVRESGMQDRVCILKNDYRELQGQYDKLVSIEMVEAVGHHYLDTFFEQCGRLLKPQGAMLLQAITINDQRYKEALAEVDFIKRHIFPGGFLPSVSVLSASVAKVTDMKIFHLEDIGPHYARTLRHWREKFQARIAEVRALGYPESFVRMWEYYFCYCEGGFVERDIGTVQVLLTKPQARCGKVA